MKAAMNGAHGSEIYYLDKDSQEAVENLMHDIQNKKMPQLKKKEMSRAQDQVKVKISRAPEGC